MRVQAIVLAAGHSTRMGHPKALTDLGGTTALERIVATCEAEGLPAPLVVLGDAHDAVRQALPQLDGRVHYVRNPAPDAGRTGSLQRGLLAMSASSALVWPVDHPLAAAATVHALLLSGGSWVVPEHAGRGGHPLLLRDVAVQGVLSAPRSMPLRDIAGMVGIVPTRVDVDDPGVLTNLDTPADVARHRQARADHG